MKENQKLKEIILQLLQEGKTIPEIVKITGGNYTTIRNYAKSSGLVISSKKTKLDEYILEEIKKDIELGLTNKQIAEKYNMSPTTARKYTTEFLKLETNSIKEKSICNKEMELSSIQLEILYGSLLGDMSIGMQWNEARVSFNHGGNQEEYFDYKCSFFTELLGKVNKTPRFDKRTNKYYNRYAVRLKCHPIFTKMYKELYPNGVKTITLEWLNKLTPRSLAFWYMDDGSNNGSLATNCFSYQELLLIQEWFKNTYNIETTIQKNNVKSRTQYILYFPSKSKIQFYNLIKEYIIPSMEYKFRGWIL